MTALRRAVQADEGLTLVETLMYCLILPVVLAIVTALLISLGHAKIAVMNTISASTSMQTVVSSVSNGIRSSSAFTIVAVPGGSDQLLEARVATDVSTFSCVVWYWSATKKTLSYKSSPPTEAIVTPTAAELSSWPVIASDISPSSGTTIFGGTAPQLNIAFKVAPGSTTPASVSTAVVSRSEQWTGDQCFTA